MMAAGWRPAVSKKIGTHERDLAAVSIEYRLPRATIKSRVMWRFMKMLIHLKVVALANKKVVGNTQIF
jgi:hypothetical protein